MKKGARRYAALALSAMLAVSGMGNLQKAEAAGVKVVSTSTGDVKVTFQASANAASYEIYRRIGNGAAKKIGTVTKPSYVDHKPAGGKKSTYTVVAVSSGAVYKNSAESKGASITLPKAVTKLKAKAAGKNVKISFKKVKGAKWQI